MHVWLSRVRNSRPADLEVTVDIRPWDDSDVDWWVGLRRDWDPSVGEDRLRELAAGQIARYVHRAVAWDRGERVGFAVISYLPGADEATAHVLVAPHRRRHGIG